MSEPAETTRVPLPAGLAGRVVYYLSAAMLFALMMVTVVDVAGRNLFNHPLRGGYELSGLLLMVLFFIALPVCTLRGGHISVNLIDGIAAPRMQRLLGWLYRLAGAAVMFAVGAFILRQGLNTMQYHEATMLLRLPVAPFVFFAAASFGVTGLVLLWQFGTDLWRGRATR